MPASLQPVTASAEVLPGVLGLRQASLDGPLKSIEAKQLADLLFCRGGCQAVKAGDIDNGPHLPQVNFTEQHTGHFCIELDRDGFPPKASLPVTSAKQSHKRVKEVTD